MSKILQTPSINAIQAFDPLNDKKIYFTYSDNQSVKNRAVIINNNTNQVVYDEIQTTEELYHIIPSSTLNFGNQYLIQIQVFDQNGNSSNLSDASLMYCYSTPTFVLNGIPNGLYKSPSIVLNLLYEQSEGEGLKSFQFFEYSVDKILLANSETRYSSTNLTHTFHNLQNGSTYYFRATGETNHGMLLDTGYIGVDVSYNSISPNVLFELKNHKCEGYIGITLNIKDIGYVLENENYSLKDGMVTLFDNELSYESGFEINNDFYLVVKAKNLPLGKFLTTNNDFLSLKLVDICGENYCCLKVKNTNIIQYEKIECDLSEIITFEVKRVNGIYGLKIY